jgi:hypothetical protein
MSGGLRVGFEWTQSAIDYDATTQQGEMQIALSFYSKQSLQLDPILKIDKLLEHSMSLDLDEFAIRHVSSMKYHQYKNMLCLDIYSEI